MDKEPESKMNPVKIVKDKVNASIGKGVADAAKAVFNSRQVHREWQ